MNIIKKRRALKLVNVCEGGERKRARILPTHTCAILARALSLTVSLALWPSLPLSRNGIKSALTPQWQPGHNVTIQLILNARSDR